MSYGAGAVLDFPTIAVFNGVIRSPGGTFQLSNSGIYLIIIELVPADNSVSSSIEAMINGVPVVNSNVTYSVDEGNL